MRGLEAAPSVVGLEFHAEVVFDMLEPYTVKIARAVLGDLAAMMLLGVLAAVA